MEEQLVSFEVAILLKQIGFSYECEDIIMKQVIGYL